MNPNKIIWSEEKEKIKQLSTKEKIRYIWTYFWIPIVAVIFVLGFGTFLAVRIATNIPDNWIMVNFANTNADLGNNSKLWRDFTKKTGYDLKEKKVDFIDESYFDYLKNQTSGNTYFNRFITLADSGKLDAITMENDSLAALAQSGRLMNLDDERCTSIKKKYGERFIYYTPPKDDKDHKEPIAVGIDLSDSLLMTEYHIYTGSCALGIGAKSENINQVEDFIDFVLGEDF